ncbi:HEAT repeat domain-containing protein [Polaribacter sp. SA4-12]|uniref:HEAT repeat domain-containing protein n=1 Tax=Polaribacter sp. SA4-12 TaxID=1312072 RepID=UPI000B3C1D0F|nr:hypothetical protein [Polaribacter sp. SA4-12]ARV16753.1 hypothetical protein BTO07_17095 [Polaribacter sp. SA4-12]
MDNFLTENIIWSIVIILVGIIFLLIIFLKIVRTKIRSTNKSNHEYSVKTEQVLIEYLYAKNEGDNSVKIEKDTIKRDLLSKSRRRIVTSIFLKVRQEVSGGLVANMVDLYEEIGLLYFAKKKLKSKKWNVIALGIRDLRLFRVEEIQDLISIFINHSKEEVRREAHLYFIEVFQFKGLSFLDDLKAPLSEWDQIMLLEHLKNFDDQEIPDVTKWLSSKNEYTVLFTLNIVQFFNRLETTDALLDLLHHPKERIRVRAIELLSHFENFEAKEILKEDCANLSNKERKAFFGLLKKTASKNDTTFVLGYIKDEVFEVKHMALQILNSINEEAYRLLETESDDEDYNKIMNFINCSHGY